MCPRLRARPRSAQPLPERGGSLLPAPLSPSGTPILSRQCGHRLRQKVAPCE